MSEIELPSYPPLNACILIDSRMSSRLELKSYIQSTHLFENLIEPESLNAGFTMITQEEIDTCIFGPSVRSDNLKNFLKDLQFTEKKSDCAFLSTYREGEKEDVVGVHAQVVFPCTRQMFNSSIIQAIQNANGGKLPLPKRRNPITGEYLFLKDAIERLEVADSGVNAETNSSLSLNTFSEHASELAKALANIEPHNLMFRPNGTPSIVTTETMQGLVNRLFPVQGSNKDLINFRLTLEQLLYGWVLNAQNSGRKIANKKLREGILGFFGIPDQG